MAKCKNCSSTSETIMAQGSEWSYEVLYDPARLGSGASIDDANVVGDTIRELFNDAVAYLGRPDIHWQPATSEVIGHACGYPGAGRCEHKTIDLDRLRGIVSEKVFSAYIDGGIPEVKKLKVCFKRRAGTLGVLPEP
jgi:hypothetical protein